MVRRRRKQARQNQARQLITQINPRSPISEQYRTVRTNIDFTSVDSDIRSMIITSSSMAEGKSVTAANLAIVYAQQGKKVLLVDSDLRKPTVHYTFRIDNLRGLTNILVNNFDLEEVTQVTSVDNLNVITSGPIPPNPSELLSSNRMSSFLEEAKKVYDIVIFDTPPILAVTDAQILANIVDGSLLVIRSNQTEYEAAIKAKEALEPAKAKLLGTVLNDEEKKKDSYYYYYSQD